MNIPVYTRDQHCRSTPMTGHYVRRSADHMSLGGSAYCRMWDCRQQIAYVAWLGTGAVAERDNKN